MSVINENNIGITDSEVNIFGSWQRVYKSKYENKFYIKIKDGEYLKIPASSKFRVLPEYESYPSSSYKTPCYKGRLTKKPYCYDLPHCKIENSRCVKLDYDPYKRKVEDIRLNALRRGKSPEEANEEVRQYTLEQSVKEQEKEKRKKLMKVKQKLREEFEKKRQELIKNTDQQMKTINIEEKIAMLKLM